MTDQERNASGFNVTVFSVVRADNWRVDEGTEPSEHNGLSPFGKVRQQGYAAS